MHITQETALPVLYFGTPVVLLTTVNPDGTSNISPLSSAWALDDRYLLGLGTDGQAYANLQRLPELVINLPSAQLVAAVEAIAPTTGRSPVPAHKTPHYRHIADKWTLGSLTAVESRDVTPPRIMECPAQMEARVVQCVPIAGGAAVAVEAEVLRVHVHETILDPARPHRIDTDRWQPLYYTFRRYFAQGEHLGANFREPLLDSSTVNP
ncbi:flavin reductase (DIM6/NTAB) family NADH-FMN oxidoreductase RutF [Microbacterium resistens]|uniref:Flavin reductase (DIM6/NTAB) family NADH-FMN oxidoreductase RutF n=1 Tax=Microbacterium resistens TaxID=156977 RepID=A0ABU1S9U8_9MICO|nr:flavin reductase family protein [Microbacterium resistens]MDR6866043.1 flavin reductase (DIM6/NTAB) family NADH-FMN oxidoreductase RutF [Microbacterium resistens]